MDKPNLFKYATSELSQDAFICWLLAWAQESFAAEDAILQGVAREMLNALFKKSNITAPASYESVIVIRQYKHIDVLVVINNLYALIIEDKTGTEDHGNQLVNYWVEIRDNGVKTKDLDLSFDEDRIMRVYFKTGDQSHYKRVTDQYYVPFLRSDMLPILQEGRKKGLINAIYADFLSYLEDIEIGVLSYQSKLLKDWEWPSWIGFFKALNERMQQTGTWQYVANPSGGFLGFNWSWKNDPRNPACHLFLQLEWDKLCFKIEVKDKDEQSRLRGEWHDLICRAGEGFASKSGRFGKGTWMTIAVYGADGNSSDYRIANADGTIDLDATVARLREVENILDRAIAERGMQQ